MKKLIAILGLFLILSSCSDNYNEPVVTGVSLAGKSTHGKYFINIECGNSYGSFWSNKEYRVGDTLTRIPSDTTKIK